MAVALPRDNSYAAFSWFTEFQRSCVLKNGIVPEWFHGIISRKAAEETLMSKPPGYFLVRVSESRVGYTLSYRGEDRCRHFMIDVLPDNQYVIVGEKQHHNSLHDLVAFHRRTPIPPYSQLLTMACEQGEKHKYVELFFPKNKVINPEQMAWTNCFIKAHVPPRSNIPEHSPISPTLPTSPTLYPCLETELSTLNLQSMEQPAKPVPKPRTICNISASPNQDTPPQLPPRDCLPSHPLANVEVDRSQGLMKVCPEKHRSAPNTPTEDKGASRNQQKHQQQSKPAILSLVQMKRKLKKKPSQSEDHTYEDISKEVFHESATFSSATLSPQQSMENDNLILHNNCTIASYRTSDGIPNSPDRQLPIEYLNPPPFAPGY